MGFQILDLMRRSLLKHLKPEVEKHIITNTGQIKIYMRINVATPEHIKDENGDRFKR